MKKYLCICVASVFFCMGLTGTILAWPDDPAVNVPVCTVPGDQVSQRITSDGDGGAIITWYDRRSGSNDDIYAQRVDASGTVQWTSDGVAICLAAGNQSYPTITSDGAGGAIITWYDRRSGSNDDIYAQRVDASGAVQWTSDGVAICSAAGNQNSPTITSDGAGGAIIIWCDRRSGSSNIYAQRVDASGAVQWTSDGVAICPSLNAQNSPEIISDGAGGAIIMWRDLRSVAFDIYTQRVDASGAVQWTLDGVVISSTGFNQYYPTITSDGAGGAIITWISYSDVYTQRVDASGTVQWTSNGEVICSGLGTQTYPEITSDGDGGAIISWQDYRSGNSDIYAQRVDASGDVQWTFDGVAISSVLNGQYAPTITTDGAGGAIITWYDRRSGSNDDIYAQRVDASGDVQWTSDGVAISTAAGTQDLPKITSDGAGGAIITWRDFRYSNKDVYAQRIYAEGNLYPSTPAHIPTTGSAGLGLMIISLSGILGISSHR